MPARKMHFTFDTKIKINKETVLQFVKDFEDEIRKNFQNIKTEFEVDEINQDFLKKFIKELKTFDCVSIETEEIHGKKRIIKDFIYEICGQEIKEPTTILGIRYLYDEWDYEGCGREDYYYLTYIDDQKMINKTIKETQKLVKKLRDLKVKVEFNIE